MGNFKSDVKRGVKWTTVVTISQSLVRLFQVSILTRFLLKEDFGTIAIATLFVGFTDLFSDMGISIGIMHKQNITKNEYSSLFWLNVFTGLFLTVVLLLIAPIISAAYNDDSLTNIIQLLSLNIFISSFGLQHQTIQRKKLNFKFISLVGILVSVLTMFVAVYLAYSGYGVYSLVYSTMFSCIVSSAIYCIYGLIKDNNIRWHFNFKDTKYFLKIGGFDIASTMLDYFCREFDTIIISTMLGKEVLGLYSLCKKIIAMAYKILTSVLSRVLTPVFAKFQVDMDDLKSKYLRLIKILSIINFPVFALITMASPVILMVLYGDNYVDGMWVVSLLAPSYALLSVASVCGSLQVALGRTDIGFYWTVYRILTNCLFIYIGAFFSIEGIALSLLVYNILNIYPFWRIQLKSMLHISLNDYVSTLKVPFIISFSLAIIFAFVVFNIQSLIVAVICGLVYMFVYIFIAHKLRYDKMVLSVLNK